MGKILCWGGEARKHPLEIEERLVGYMAVMETEIIKRYGGGEIIGCGILFICNVGKSRDTINFMGRFFLLWKNKMLGLGKRNRSCIMNINE